MGNFIHIRGWLETEFELVPKFKEIVQRFNNDYSRYLLIDWQAKLYQKGWHFPSHPINYTSYIFYGADVKYLGEDYIKDQIIAMVQLFDETNGLFYFNDDEGDYPIAWKIFDSKITEENRVNETT
jgi:hypothetical protein